MTLNDPNQFIIKDRWLFLIALVLLFITGWNSRFVIIPAPNGYTRYVKHDVVFLYPENLQLWELAIHEDGTFREDGSEPVTEYWGTVGWNTGNTLTPSDSSTMYWQESGITWYETSPPEDLLSPCMFFSAIRGNAERRGRELNLAEGQRMESSHRGHSMVYQYFNYTSIDESNTVSQIYGIICGFYCEDTGRMFEVYYKDIYDLDPVYDPETMYTTFKYYLDSLHCH